MITLFDTLQVDITVLSIALFIYAFALIAIFQMHDYKKGFLFLVYITGTALLLFLFLKYSLLSSVVVFLYIAHLVYNNLRGSRHHIED